MQNTNVDYEKRDVIQIHDSNIYQITWDLEV